MPNHVRHILQCRAAPEVLDALAEAVRLEEDGKVVDFAAERIIPAPPCVFRGDLGRDEEEKHPGRNWYAWNIRRWGSKWGCYSTSTERPEPELLIFRFETAWSSAMPLIEELSHLFPEVAFEFGYIDEGWNFAFSGTARQDRAVGICRTEFTGPHIVSREIRCARGVGDFERLYVLVYGEPVPEEE